MKMNLWIFWYVNIPSESAIHSFLQEWRRVPTIIFLLLFHFINSSSSIVLTSHLNIMRNTTSFIQWTLHKKDITKQWGTLLASPSIYSRPNRDSSKLHSRLFQLPILLFNCFTAKSPIPICLLPHYQNENPVHPSNFGSGPSTSSIIQCPAALVQSPIYTGCCKLLPIRH